MQRKDLLLYAITDRTWLKPEETMAEAVEKAILGGATIIQLREKKLIGNDLEKEAIEVRDVCRKYGIPFVINDDVELACKIGADGVHVGQSDMAAEEARKRLPKDAIVGVTAKTIEQAKKAEAAGASYLGSGAVFGSSTKTDAIPMTHQLFKDICQSVSIPVVAIGGITIDNVTKLKGLPMAGIATVSGVFANEDIIKSTHDFLETVKSVIEGE